MHWKKTKESICGQAGRIIDRHMKNIGWILFGSFIIGAAALLISDLDTGGRSRVYAVYSSQDTEAKEQQVQTGLMGLIYGVERMQSYSDAAHSLSITNKNESSLAGLGAVSRSALRRSALEKGTKKAAELGYYAQQTVYENQMPEEEYETLLQIVEAEATGADLTSKMMVASVVLNRVKDEHFPDTISEVVWQDSQFQPVSDGRYYTVTVTGETIEAVDRVMEGEDPSQGALFFFSRDSSESQNITWFDSSLVPLFEYGGHEYFTFKEYVSEI